MTIEIGERVDKAVKEEQSHLSLTRARERAKVHQDTHSGIRHLSNWILIRLHRQHGAEFKPRTGRKGFGRSCAQKELPLCSQSVCPPTGSHEETIIRYFS